MREATIGNLDALVGRLIEHERKFDASFSLIPSENMLSPLARLAYASDCYSRYFFNEHEVFGRWTFEGGSIAGRIQNEILAPLLLRYGGARHVNVAPVSGLTGMTVALAAFGGAAGSTILSVPLAAGGHPDTDFVAARMGLDRQDIPFASWAEIDLAALADKVARTAPSLVYFDHATHLFPLDLETVIDCIRSAAPRPVHVHVDTSHVNGLVWGGVHVNPLAAGADSYGGSTHKTFPGPHKAVLFSNDDDIAEKIVITAVNMVSHHHTSSVVALAIAMIEFDECGGPEYAAQTLANARAFAAAMAETGFDVQGLGTRHTANHQVWTAAPTGRPAHVCASRLFSAGLVVNPHDPLPSLGGAGLRMGLNEPTRLGLKEDDMAVLAGFFGRLLLEDEPAAGVSGDVAAFRAGRSAAYCFDEEVTADMARRLAARAG